MTPLRTLALLVVLTACSSGSAAPAALPTVEGGTVSSVRAARTLCSGEPPTTTAPTARHTILKPNTVAGLRRSPQADTREFESGLVGSGQSLKFLAQYDGSTTHVKAVVLSAAPGAFGTERLGFLCRSATGYVAADVTAVRVTGFDDDLECFEIPKDDAKPVLCGWYDDTAGTLTLNGVHGTAALDLAIAFRAALEKPIS